MIARHTRYAPRRGSKKMRKYERFSNTLLKASYVFVIAVAIATLVPVSIAISDLTSQNSAIFGSYTGDSRQQSEIFDARGDARPVLQASNATIIPDVQGYHDIVSVRVQKFDSSFQFTIELAGNPNLGGRYETNYMWNIITESGQHYIVMFPHFPADFNYTSIGWYYAVYNNTAETYLVPQTKIEGGMPENRVEYRIADWLIGEPDSFRYWVTVSVRVDSMDLNKPPDYLMDYAP